MKEVNYLDMDILEIYKNKKKSHRKDKHYIILASMQEIDFSIASAKIDDKFLKAYKFYKYMLLLTNTIIPSMVFGLGTGTITTVMGFFLNNISDAILLTFSNLLFVTVGFIGIIVLYILSCRGVLVYILLPYTVKKIEEKINDFNSYCLSDSMDSNQEYKVEVKRINNDCKKKQDQNGNRLCKHNKTLRAIRQFTSRGSNITTRKLEPLNKRDLSLDEAEENP